MNIKQLHELTGEVINREDNIANLIYKIKCLDETKCVSGKVEIQIGDRRSTTMAWLTRDEIKIVLERMLNQEMIALGIAQTQFDLANVAAHF